VLDEGVTYVASDFAIPFTFRANDGWNVVPVEDGTTALTMGNATTVITIAAPDMLFLRGPIDACRDCPDVIEPTRSIDAPPSVDEWLAAFAEIAAITVLETSDVDVPGAPAAVRVRVDVLDIPGSTTPGGDRGTGVFTAAGRNWGLPRGTSEVTLIETQGGVLWISVRPGRGTMEDAQAQAQPLIDSIGVD
jgi:hypothetical protein